MLGALLGAGASIIGSIFGSKKQKTETTSTVDYARMVKDATAAGFNPLTALRNGGAAGFSTGTTTSPGLSSAQFIGDAIGGVANAWANFDPMADQKKELEFNLVQAQLENLQADTKYKSRSFEVPGYTATSKYRGNNAGALSASTLPTGNPTAPVVGQVEVTNPWDSFLVDPTSRNASAFTDRYGEGEVAETLLLAKQGYSDLKYNFENNDAPFWSSIRSNLQKNPRGLFETKQGWNDRKTYRLPAWSSQ